jgi:BlaI family transcriptional regulator, penicillinase repressor
MENGKKYHPTESELEILQVLWEKGDATVRDVFEILEKGRDIGYTTTLKTMQIMTEKGMLGRDTTSRTHIYTPLVSREGTQKQFLNKMIDGLYKGSAGRLVIGALGHKRLSPEDIREIQDYLKQFEDPRS